MQMRRDVDVIRGAAASGRVEGAAVMCWECCTLGPNICFIFTLPALGLVGIWDHDEIQRHNKDLHDFLCSGEKRPWSTHS